MSDLERSSGSVDSGAVQTDSGATTQAPAPTMLGGVGASIGSGMLQRKLISRRARSRGEGGTVSRSATGEAAAADPGAAFSQATSGGGGEVPFRGEMERSFGQDFSGVSAHVGKTEEMHSISAHAATNGEQIAFADSSPSKELVAHELTHVVQQRQSGGPAATQNKDMLSDPGSASEREADAVASRVAAGEQVTVHEAPDTGLNASLFGDAVSFVVDGIKSLFGITAKSNTPESGKGGGTTPERGKDGGGGGGTVPPGETAKTETKTTETTKTETTKTEAEKTETKAKEATDLVDEAIAANDATKLTAAASTDDLQKYAIEQCKAKGKPALLRTPPFRAVYYSWLKKLFKAESDLTKKRALAEERFGIEFGPNGSTGLAWDAVGLAQTWDVLERLPEGHVTNTDQLKKFLRKGDTPEGAGGAHGGDTATISYDPNKIGSTKNSAANAGDPLFGVNRFDKVVRHEVGHAVDARLGLRDKYCIGNAAGGDWKVHTDLADLASTIVTASGGYISKMTDNTKKQGVITALQTAMSTGNKADVDTEIDKVAGLDNTEKTAIKNDQAVTVLKTHFASESPWYTAPGGGVALSGRVYQQSYNRAGGWVSYDNTAKTRQVSKYQWRAPGEWIAEAYATYYEPGPGASGKKEDHAGDDVAGDPPGTHLATIDPDTKSWFDNNVHNK